MTVTALKLRSGALLLAVGLALVAAGVKLRRTHRKETTDAA